jgi:two-component system, LytTR family, sensor kinase
MRRRFQLLPSGWSLGLLLLAWSVPVVLGIPFTLSSLQSGATGQSPWRILLIVVACWQTWTLLSVGVVHLTDRMPVQRPWRVRVLALHAMAALAACALQAAATAVTTSWLTPGVASVRDIFIYWFMLLTPAGVIVYAAVVAIRTAQRRGEEVRARAEEAKELARQLTESQLLALRSQLRPHFLFNTLNAVLALVRDGENTRAADAITALAALLRATLHGDARREIPLGEELRFIDEYLRIELLRHEARLGVQVHVSDGLRQLLVPNLVLQPLVENALKHGVARTPGRVDLTIAAEARGDSVILRVEDTGAGIQPTYAIHTGVGIANLRARLERLYPSHGRVELRDNPAGRGAVAEICLPARYGVA